MYDYMIILNELLCFSFLSTNVYPGSIVLDLSGPVNDIEVVRNQLERSGLNTAMTGVLTVPLIESSSTNEPQPTQLDSDSESNHQWWSVVVMICTFLLMLALLLCFLQSRKNSATYNFTTEYNQATLLRRELAILMARNVRDKTRTQLEENFNFFDLNKSDVLELPEVIQFMIKYGCSGEEAPKRSYDLMNEFGDGATINFEQFSHIWYFTLLDQEEFQKNTFYMLSENQERINPDNIHFCSFIETRVG